MTIRIDGTNSAANPGITGSDTDTGLQFGTDEVNIVTGGSTAATVDSSQRLLVGTSSDIAGNANALLQLVNSASPNLVIGTTNTATTDGTFLGLQRFFSNAGSTQGEAARITAQLDGTASSSSKPGRLVFHTTSSGGSLTERLRITSDGTLQLRNSPGIDFGQIQGAPDAGTSTSEVLDSYEEGTWTPTISVEGQADTAIDNVNATYVKVGQIVNCSFHCFLNGTPTNRSSANAFQFGGLPFISLSKNSNGADDYIGSVRLHDIDNGSTLGVAAETVLRLFDNSRGGRIEIRRGSTGDISNGSLWMKDNMQIAGTITYRTGT